jgi:hypothetical protein
MGACCAKSVSPSQCQRRIRCLVKNDAQYAECTILTLESGTTVVRALGNHRFEFRDLVLGQDGGIEVAHRRGLNVAGTSRGAFLGNHHFKNRSVL